MNDKVLTVRIARRHEEAEGIVSFDLAAVDGSTLPAVAAGAHIDVHVPGGLIRQYSLCNAPSERHRYQIAVLRDPSSRGGSISLHDSAHEGDILRIGAPRNHFPLATGTVQHLLLAGGIGLTPLLSMAEQLAHDKLPFQLHYCARSPARAAFLERLGNASWSASVWCHFDDGDEDQRLDLNTLLSRPAHDQHLYVCGPQGFINAVLAVGRINNWSPERVHYEYFGAAPVVNADESTFQVRLVRSGRTVAVPPRLTVTQALSEAGIDIPVSCEQGVCGTCITRVLDGEPDHRDLFLTPEEHARNDQFLPCCSRSKSSMLVLDL